MTGKLSTKITLLIAIFLLFWLKPVEGGSAGGGIKDKECFMILAGRGVTEDGSVMLAHNNDLSGREKSALDIYPRREHSPGEMVDFPSGLEIPQVHRTFRWMALRIEEGFSEGDAVAVNEYGVAVAGGVALGKDRNDAARKFDPLVEGGLTGGVRYIALQRSRTARECVKILGELYNRYGVTYPCGVGVADTSEVWYIESGGGHCWAAVRVPDSCCWVQANGYRIGKINPEDSVNVMTSPGLLRFCRETGLWDPDTGFFSFRDAFGGKYWKERKDKYYNSRRVWRGMDLLAPSMELSPERERYPMFLVPEVRVSLELLFEILRDHYQGTPFDGYPGNGRGSGERLIASPRCVHTDVIQLRPGMPVEVGAVMWSGLSMPQATIYVPFYSGIYSIPDGYACGREECSRAFWIFRRVSRYLLSGYHQRLPDIAAPRRKLENEWLSRQAGMESRFLKIFNSDRSEGRRVMTGYVEELSDRAIRKAEEVLVKWGAGESR